MRTVIKKKRLNLIFITLITLLAAVSLFALTSKTPPVKADGSNGQAPILFSVSDAIKPGDSMAIFGNYLKPNASMQVAYAPAKGEMPGVFNNANPPEGVKYLTQDNLTVTDDTYGTGIMTVFPKTSAPGRYDFWVKNENGWSRGITLNAVRPLYIDQEASYEGLPIEIAGRNFFADEYGVDTNPLDDIRIKLVRVGDINGVEGGASETYTVKVKDGVRVKAENSFNGLDIEESNPYRLTFITPKVTTYGTYDVYVAPDGLDFRPLARPQKLIIYERKAEAFNTSYFGLGEGIGNDPLGLGVYWAQNLNYTNVTTVNAATAAKSSVQAQIDNLGSSGGGVLYFPNGTYNLGQLNLKNNVILVGQSRAGTILRFTTTDSRFINGAGVSNVGLARLTLTIAPSVSVPDRIVNIDEANSVSNTSKKQVQNVFMSDVEIAFPRPSKGQAGWFDNTLRGISVYSGLKNFVFQNMKTVTNHTPLYGSFYSYSKIRNCDLTMNGDVASPGHKYSFVENTSLVAGNEGHGWSGRTDCYFANNYVADIGEKDYNNGKYNDNKGEIIMFEPPNGYFTRGSILSAAARTFTVLTESRSSTVGASGEIDSDTSMAYNYFAVVIVEGKGTGQMRYFEPSSITSDSGGFKYQLCANERDFDVIPDSTSKFSIYLPMEGATVYRLKGENCAKSLYFYGQIHDAVAIENELTNTEGIGITSALGNGRLATDMNIRIERNIVKGVSPATGKGGIYLTAGRGNSAYGGMMAAMITIRDNTILNTVSDFIYASGSELPGKRGLIIHTNNESSGQISGDARYIIAEGNTINNSEYGVYCDSRISGVIVRRNNFSGIKNSNIVQRYPVNFNVDAQVNLFIDNVKDNSLSGGFILNEELPVPAEKPGKAFWGWSLSSTVRGDNPVIKATGSAMTLYAFFDSTVYWNITYYLDGGTYSGSGITTYNEGVGLSLGNAVKDGYKFDGWYTDAGFANKVTAITAADSGDKKLYAKFILEIPPGPDPDPDPDPELAVWNITYYLDGGTYTGSGITSYTEGVGLTLGSAAKLGYTFDGWYTDAGFVNKITVISETDTGNITLYAKFTATTPPPPPPSSKTGCGSTAFTNKDDFSAKLGLILITVFIVSFIWKRQSHKHKSV